MTRGLLWACGALDDPTAFGIIAAEQRADALRVAWQSVPGWRYEVQAAADVNRPWNAVDGGELTATNVVSTRSLPWRADPQRFVRVALLE